MFDEMVSILENRKMNDEYWKLSFRSPKLARGVRAGQFVNIQIEENTDPFLRRPFSYYRVTGNRVEILYEILGRGTRLLTLKQKKDRLQVLGPLGKSFTEKLRSQKKRVLVAGGVGVPPLVFLAETTSIDYLLIGCKTKGEVLPKKELQTKAKVLYTTEDGSYGKKGFVTALLREVIEQEENPRSIFIQTCGPHAMMEAAMKLAGEFGIEGEASIDERMACGVGACLGCMVKTHDGYKTSCTEGPVFSFSELVHD